MKDLENIIEAIFFALGRSILVEELVTTLKTDRESITNAITNLQKKYTDKDAIVLVKIKDKYQLVTNHKYYDYVKLFVENTKKQNLSTAAYEVLSIIAYNPKITKTQIESIRGVNSDSVISNLLVSGLIEESARLNLPGRPAAYSVTDEFLKSCGIDDISKLPQYDKNKLTDEQIIVSDIEKNNDNNDDNDDKI